MVTPETRNIQKLISQSKKTNDRTDLHLLLNNTISKLSNANIICAFDMEFSDREAETITEVGISIHNKQNNESTHQHFIIADQIGQYKRNNTPVAHSNLFSYGYSQVTTLDSALSFLNLVMKNSDVNIIYSPDDKQKHMDKHNFDKSDFISIQELVMLCTENSTLKSIGSMVEKLKSKEQPVHNAGNDSASTLEILSALIGDKIGFKNYKPLVVIDNSEHKDCLSINEIRQRRSNSNKAEKTLSLKNTLSSTTNKTNKPKL